MAFSGIDPHDAAVFRAYVDNLNAPPDARMAALDNMSVAPPPEQLSSEPTYSPAPPPQVADVGPQVTVPPEELQSTAPPEPQMSMAPEPAPAAPPGPQAPPTINVGGLEVGDAYSAWLAQGLQRSPGRVIPEHAQPQGYSRSFVPDVDRSRFETAIADQAETQARGADAAAGQDLLGADAARGRKVAAAADLAEFSVRQDAARQELEQREGDYRKLVEESKVAPDEFWRRRDTGEKVLAAIGGLLMGLGGGADKFIQMIEGERQHAQQERDKRVASEASRLDDFRSRVMSPAAAAAYEDAIKARITAEDLRMMAAQAGSVEKQTIGKTEAAKLEAYAAQKELEARQQMAGEIQERVAIIPSRVVGGGGGVPEFIRRVNMTPGLSDEQKQELIKQAASGVLDVRALQAKGPSLSGEAQVNLMKDERDRRVRLPDGSFGWAKNGATADKVQTALNTNDIYMRNLDEMEGLLRRGISLDPKLRTRYNQLAQDNRFLIKNIEELGALTDNDSAMSTPFTGEGGEEATTFTATMLEQLQGAKRYSNKRTEKARLQLYSDADVTKPMVTETEQGLGGRPVQ